MKNEPELWWFVYLPDKKFEFRKATWKSMIDDFNDCKINDYTVVHSDNEMYPAELRSYNRKHIRYINRCYVGQLEKMISLKAPAVVIAKEDIGAFSIRGNIMENYHIDDKNDKDKEN